MRVFILLIFLLAITSCGLFKQKTVITNEQHQVKDREIRMGIKEETATKNSKQQLFAGTDSTQQDYTIQLWPKGTIHLTSDNEITGEFDSLIIKGRQQQVSKISEMLNAKDEHQYNSVTGLLDSKRITADQKQEEKKNSYNIKWILLSLGLTVFIVLLLIWKRFFQKN